MSKENKTVDYDKLRSLIEMIKKQSDKARKYRNRTVRRDVHIKI